MVHTEDKHPRRRIMEVEEIADEKEEKKIKLEEPVPPVVIPTEEPEEKPQMQKESLPFENMAKEQLQEHEYEKDQKEEPSIPKKDIVSELFHTNETTVGYPDVSIAKKPSKGIPVVVWIVLLFVIVGSIGGGLLFFKNQSASAPSQSPEAGTDAVVTIATTPTQTPTPTISASASAAVKKEITIQVWNGSGKPGAASLMKELLEEKGYTVKNTGNAPSYSKDLTAIYIKSDKEEYLDILKKDIEEKYEVGTVSATLDEGAYDARVIVGQE